jgi:hypothetical protein
MATRILLRSRADGRFVSGVLAWSSDSKHAHEFQNAQAADSFAREHSLRKMEIVVIRETGPQLRIPLDRAASE